MGRRAAGTDYEPGIRKLIRYFERCVRVLKAMSEDEVESARSEIAKSVLEVGGGFRLHQCCLGAELTFDELQSVERGRIPARVTHRSGCQQGDSKSGRRRSGRRM